MNRTEMLLEGLRGQPLLPDEDPVFFIGTDVNWLASQEVALICSVFQQDPGRVYNALWAGRRPKGCERILSGGAG